MDAAELTIEFEGSITITREELDEADGDAGQAVQNRIGHTGAEVDMADATLDMAAAVREVMEWDETILPAPFRRRRGAQAPRSRDAS